MSKRDYHGRCHCGAIRFRIACEPITAGRRCNCSLCIRRGAVMSVPYFGGDDFALVAGADALARYVWGDKMMHHYFCKHCGVYPFSATVEEPVTYRVNLGCLDDVDPLALEVEVI